MNAIIDASGGVIYDAPNSLDTPPNSGIHTLTLSDFLHGGAIDGKLTWFGAQAWVNYLNVADYQGYSNWRLPTTMDSSASVGYPNGGATNLPVSSSELAELFYGQLGQLVVSRFKANTTPAMHSSATYGRFVLVGYVQVAAAPGAAWVFDDSDGEQLTNAETSYNAALAVRSGQAYQCETTYDGTFKGNVTVTTGLVCIVNATVTGNVQEAGGQLRIVGSIVGGNVQVERRWSIYHWPGRDH